MIRKRAPGGGRKPSPHTARAQLTVRMPDDLRAELEVEAQKRDRTLTDELLARLRSSLANGREQERDPALRALNFVIAQLAERISSGMYMADRKARLRLQKDWRTDPFKFAAFRFAVGKLLDELQPPGKISPPGTESEMRDAARYFSSSPEFERHMIEAYKTPEAHGAMEFGFLWTQLTRTNPPTEKEKEFGVRFPRFGEVMEREFYGFEKARRDLGIETKEPQP